MWDLEGQGFAGCFLVKKEVSNDDSVKEGSWDSIHVVEVTEHAGGRASYKLTTTVMLHMAVSSEAVGETDLSGSLTRQAELADVAVDVDHPHVAHMGRLIEDMETEVRSNMDSLYIQKTKEIVGSVRRVHASADQGVDFTKSLNAAVLAHGGTRKIDSES